MERFHVIFLHCHVQATNLHFGFISLYMLVNGESVQPYKALLKDAQVIKVQFIDFVATENIARSERSSHTPGGSHQRL